MSTIPLKPTDEVKEWLREHLKDNMKLSGALISEKKELKKFMNENFKGEKGIYFWFLKVEALDLFLKYLPNPKVDKGSFYELNFNDLKYILVYLGTAGVRKNKNEKNNSNLLDRLNWHLFNAQTEKSVSNGIMSTLRRTLGALISNDLIAEDTQSNLTDIINENFIIHFLPYGKETVGKEYLNIQLSVSKNETMLIENLKPIFNLSQNLNKKDSEHITHVISKRRKEVEINTKERLTREIANTESTSKKGNPKNSSKFENSRIKNGSKIYNDRLKDTKDGCFEFFVNQSESIHDVIASMAKLPKGKFSVQIHSSSDKNLIFNYWKSSGTSKIYTYFENQSTSEKYKGQRDKLIRQWMIENKIEEITVLLCPVE